MTLSTASACFISFLADERQRFVAKCGQVLEPQGAMYFTVISDSEMTIMVKGWRSKNRDSSDHQGKRLHFYTEEDFSSAV